MTESGGGYRTLERAAALLDAVEIAPATASELARRTGLSTSTAHRLALALVEAGLLARVDGGRFGLGARFRRSALEQAAVLPLTRLRDATGETAQLWVRDGDERVCLASVDSRAELRATLPVGHRLPLPAGSAGRLLAEDPEAWAHVAAHGWLESVSQRTPGLASVSAPVRRGDTVVAVVCLAMPWSRAEQPGDLHGEAVVEAASAVEAALGR